MSAAPTLHWLPDQPDWRASLQRARRTAQFTWHDAVALANARLDFIRTNSLDAWVTESVAHQPTDGTVGAPIRLAILGTSTHDHLHAGIRVAGLRRGLRVTTYQGEYGQYRQELSDPGSGLHSFQPSAVLFTFDAWHMTAGLDAAATTSQSDAAFDRVVQDVDACWRMAREAGCTVLQQAVLPAFGPLIGNNEHRLPGSRATLVHRLNETLRTRADAAGVHLVALDTRVAQDGLDAWHDVALWHRAKQEVSPAAAPLYGELVARLLAAIQGRSSKCLVLDLDNTLWGGVVGDDGVDGLVLGQGSAAGESFAAVQGFARDLARRGVILAVCSKNDEANALEAFDRHPEMVLKRSDIACFVANWSDKAANLRMIADTLNVGLDSLVFLDDNPAERRLVRAELPMVAVPELPDEPALFPRAIMDAGYFESVGITADDRARVGQYRDNRLRDVERASATDMPAFLRGLEMRLVWRPFDRAGQGRIAQLVNKTNQFNLTTRRTTEDECARLMQDPLAMALQLRLLDRFGDNGIISIIIGRLHGEELRLDTWLMSCRVLGRQVEAASLNLVAEQARAMGARRLRGLYVPSNKNGMVCEHYQRLGFTVVAAEPDGTSESLLELDVFTPHETAIILEPGST